MQSTLLDGRYELEQKLGEGGMAVVYRGLDRRLNRRVAIKILHSHYATDRDFLDRFQHEAQAAALLNHPNVVNVYDVGQDGATHYIVMEYVEGTNLKTLINREGPLPIARAVTIAIAIAQGLAAAHKFGLIHRDIKPQNIMVRPDGHVQITDFGIAKSHLSTALTQTGITFGTADYISPEQARGEPATPRSDIYALGVTLFEMLTARLPFPADNAVAVAMHHVNTPPPALRQFNPQVPPQLEALVQRTLAKDPYQRPANAEEFAHLLKNYHSISDQETVFNPHVVRYPQEPGLVRPAMPAPGNGSSTGRTPIAPPRPTITRVPRQEGSGCGLFVLGMFLLVGILGVVFLFTSGAFDGLFAGVVVNDPAQPGQATPTVIVTVMPSITPTPTMTPTPAPNLATVPDITGQTEAAARSALEQARLVAVQQGQTHSDSVPENHVLSQSIAAGTQVVEGSTVGYTVSLGSRFISLPDFTQRQIESVRNEAAAAGLNVDVSEEPSRNISEGFVIRQSPNPGARLSAGDTVRIVVSIGDRVQMPELTGRSEEEARAVLANTDGLEWSYTDLQGPDRLPTFFQHRPGEVVSMAFTDGRPIQGGQWVPRGTRVVLGVRAPE